MCSGAGVFSLREKVCCTFERGVTTPAPTWHASVKTHEWWLACSGMMDPCFGQRHHLLLASSLIGPSPCPAKVGCPVLPTYLEGILLARTVGFPSRAAPPRWEAVRVGPQGSRRASRRLHPDGCLRCPIHGATPDISGAEHLVGSGPRASVTTTQSSLRFVRTTVGRSRAALSQCGWGRAGVGEECYLVDPASSHMLVSKIKPCMCKYELIQTVKLRMAH